MICFQISIFEPLETTYNCDVIIFNELWFAFKLVSLNHWKQLYPNSEQHKPVVICFQISIFEPLETTGSSTEIKTFLLWFAFKLVSLNHWKQLLRTRPCVTIVVICFQISIFEPLETTRMGIWWFDFALWFAFKLVSLNHWKQHVSFYCNIAFCCDLLSN